METLGSKPIWSWLDGWKKAGSEDPETKAKLTNSKIRGDRGHQVDSYLELARKVSELQYRNRDYVFLFRGQRRDYRNKRKNSTLPPSLLRSEDIGSDFAKLQRAERLLIEGYRLTGADKITRHQALRWAILQHYEVCPTPLLDVTQSLRIAASFASQPETSEAFVYVLGVPNISGAITASDEVGLEVIRLSSVCPPEAVRPHIQEGYLLSEFPELADLSQKAHYENHDLDFGRRIVAKFRFSPDRFWEIDPAFPMIPREALYPTHPNDPLLDLTSEIKSKLG